MTTFDLFRILQSLWYLNGDRAPRIFQITPSLLSSDIFLADLSSSNRQKALCLRVMAVEREKAWRLVICWITWLHLLPGHRLIAQVHASLQEHNKSPRNSGMFSR